MLNLRIKAVWVWKALKDNIVNSVANSQQNPPLAHEALEWQVVGGWDVFLRGATQASPDMLNSKLSLAQGFGLLKDLGILFVFHIHVHMQEPDTILKHEVLFQLQGYLKE